MKPASPDEPVYLTADGLRRMQSRLEELKASLPALIAEAARTAAEGDRSENDAYKQSKSLLRRTHRQIWNIEDQMKRVAVIEPGKDASGAARRGSVVTLATGDSAEEKTFEIVGPRESNPSRGRISQESPLGSALTGHKEGETVSVKTLNGEKRYTIVKVR